MIRETAKGIVAAIHAPCEGADEEPGAAGESTTELTRSVLLGGGCTGGSYFKPALVYAETRDLRIEGLRRNSQLYRGAARA